MRSVYKPRENFEDNAIDAETLSSLTAEDLAEMEISENDASTILWGISNLTPIFAWLSGLELTDYITAFASNRIEFGQIAELDKDDLKEIGITVLGHRKKILGNLPGSSTDTSSAQNTEASTPAAEDASDGGDENVSDESGESRYPSLGAG